MATFLNSHLGLLPPHPPDGFLWFIWLVLVSIAAAVGAGLGLAWRHVSMAPRVLFRAGVFLVPLSVWMLWSHVDARREVPRMLARADSSRSTVLGHNAFGSLLVLGRYPHGVGRTIAPWKREHARLSSGDTVVIYFERTPPHNLLDVAPAGPDIRVTLHRLFWLWLVGVALLVGYGPRLNRWLGKPLRGRDRPPGLPPVGPG